MSALTANCGLFEMSAATIGPIVRCPVAKPQTNGMVGRYNGCVEDVQQSQHLHTSIQAKSWQTPSIDALSCTVSKFRRRPLRERRLCRRWPTGSVKCRNYFCYRYAISRDVAPFRALRFGGVEVTALDGVSLDMDNGVLATMLGPCGCSKSTLLRAVAELGPRSSGSIDEHGETPSTAGKRGILPSSFRMRRCCRGEPRLPTSAFPLR